MKQTRKLAAIMFTDIVGYTAMMEKDERQALAIAGHHEKMLEACHARHGGEVLNYYGDGSLSIFPSAAEAVRCGVEIQHCLQREPQVPLRIGIHIGEVLLKDGKAYGDGVNIASRIEGLGVAGAVLVSRKVKEEIKNQSDIITQSMGLFQMKNVERPMEVFAVKGEGLVIPEPRQMEGKGKRVVAQSGKSKEERTQQLLLRALALVGSLAIIVVFLSIYFKPFEAVSSNEPLKLTRFSTSAWFEGFPGWSPDGSMVAYVSLAPGNADLFFKNRKEGKAIQLTETPWDEYNPRWSPDGSRIAYISTEERNGVIFLIPSTGGLKRKLVDTKIPSIEQFETVLYALGTLPWSPDGRYLIFSRLMPDGRLAVWMVEIETGEEEQVTFPEAGGVDLSASWSPDGRSIVFQRNGQLMMKNLGENQSRLLLQDQYYNLLPVFSADGHKVLFSSMRLPDVNIWELDLSSEKTQQLTFSTKWMIDVTPLATGELSVDEFDHQIDLMIKDMNSGVASRLTNHNGGNYYGRFSPDGTKIIYQSDRSGNMEIWMIDLNENNLEINLTDHPSIDIQADWSPDGHTIAFFSNREGVYKVWIMDTEGMLLKKASEEQVQFRASDQDYYKQLKWSPDGKWIGYLAQSEGGSTLWVVDPEKNTARPVIPGVHSFDWYRDGQRVVYARYVSGHPDPSELVIANLQTGEEELLYRGQPLTELFVASSGEWIGYTNAPGHISYNLFRLQLQAPADPSGFPTVSGEPEQLTFGAGKWHVHNGAASPDGERVLYSRDADRMDIYLIENYESR